MLSKELRLNVSDFKAKKPLQQRRNAYFLLKVFSSEEENPRFGVVVSKKVHALASSRNKLRRRIFDFFRENLGKIAKGRDYLLIVSPSASKLEENSAIVRHLENLFFGP
ncbi:MAG: ribonuclease P protein component [bacterium]|nr:ribonuclease P protein component [bacterium]